jgi:hypothetical protein
MTSKNKTDLTMLQSYVHDNENIGPFSIETKFLLYKQYQFKERKLCNLVEENKINWTIFLKLNNRYLSIKTGPCLVYYFLSHVKKC